MRLYNNELRNHIKQGAKKCQSVYVSSPLNDKISKKLFESPFNKQWTAVMNLGIRYYFITHTYCQEREQIAYQLVHMRLIFKEL